MSTGPYTTEVIYPLLQKTLYCSFSTHQGRDIRSRFLVFACLPDLKAFFFLTRKTSEKVRQLKADPRATACILSTSEALDDFSETVVIGEAEALSDLAHPAAQSGLQRLAEKAREMRRLLEAGDLGAYVLVRLLTRELQFRVYQDIIAEVPGTLIRF